MAAALLIEKGYTVLAGYMILSDLHLGEKSAAQRIGHKLGIECKVFDFREQFNKIIISDFIEEYKNGRTPNPCVICNQKIKFDLLFNEAVKLKFDLLATGHYARITRSQGRFFLKKGIDKNEQSYFLYRLKQPQLARILLPLGLYTKDQVREIARQRGLPSASRSKSHDACFIPNADFVEFMKMRIPEEPGKIIDQKGRILGKHKGIWRYTFGQRRGLGISYHKPYYVMGIDAKNNTVIVGEQKDIFGQELIADKMNYLDINIPKEDISVKVKIRYAEYPASARLKPL
ncbi:tRNA 2-thiouridine(34) synthase MnmA, partial [candidate division WOR-3 bacterium RBG_13_43_14]